MEIAITENFLDDLLNLQSNLQKKCRDMLSAMSKLDSKNLSSSMLPGWRFHKLKTSPFASMSIDMNYRILCKIDGETLYVHRAVKHDVADESRINRNDTAKTPYTLANSDIQHQDIYKILESLGLPNDKIQPFKDIKNDDELLGVLGIVDGQLAELALAFYETTGVALPRTKYLFLQDDIEFKKALFEKEEEWEIYLHPSQKYITELPYDYRLTVSGSAGTGKTICAWHRMLYLAQQGLVVGFACPSKNILEISQLKIQQMLGGNSKNCYYFIPTTKMDLAEYAKSVNHIVIDEGQEFKHEWYEELGKTLTTISTGVTVFYDINQIGLHIAPNHVKPIKNRIKDWENGLQAIPQRKSVKLYINYRNSREITEYYYNTVVKALPQLLTTEIPLFNSGEVTELTVEHRHQLTTTIGNIIRQLQKDFGDHEIAIIFLDDYLTRKEIETQFGFFGATKNLNAQHKIITTTAREFRGREKKAVIVCVPFKKKPEINLQTAINSYIAFSRARDKLVVILLGE